jgi:hypothetical protein
MTGKLLPYMKESNSDSEDSKIYRSLYNCLYYNDEQGKEQDTAPLIQFMLDLLGKDFQEKQLSGDPLDEQPYFAELYLSHEWLNRRGMNHESFAEIDKNHPETERSVLDLATEAYIYNLQAIENS